MVKPAGLPDHCYVLVTSGGPLRTGSRPVRPHEVARVPARITLQVILVLHLGLPELGGRHDLRHDLARPRPEPSTSAIVSSAMRFCSSVVWKMADR